MDSSSVQRAAVIRFDQGSAHRLALLLGAGSEDQPSRGLQFSRMDVGRKTELFIRSLYLSIYACMHACMCVI